MAEARRYPARGLSMLPSLYPRDELHVVPADVARVRPGDLVAFPDATQVVCHRVLRSERRAGVRWFEVRGDGQTASEWVPEGALVFTVLEVDGRLGRWRADGPRGRLLARVALSDALPARALRLWTAAGLRAYARLRRRIQ